MHAIDERPSAAYRLCHRPIRQQHELLDQVVRLARLLEIDLCREAVLVQFKPHLLLLDRQRPVRNPLRPHLLRQLVQDC